MCCGPQKLETLRLNHGITLVFSDILLLRQRLQCDFVWPRAGATYR
jgi:hypothetical protein